MIKYSNYVLENLQKGIPSEKIFENIDNAFRSIELTKDLDLFDIKSLKQPFYRLRKGKYRAIFHFEDSDIVVDYIATREEAYKWLNQSD